jgi:Ca2+-transporting ATPase
MTGTFQGLSSREAQRKLSIQGFNELRTIDRATPFQMFLGQLKSPLVVILFLATGASFFLGNTLEGALILSIVLLNAVLGFLQEFRAEKALSALKQMTVSKSRVIRDNVVGEIDNKLLVPGDIILLEEGDNIPADARLLAALHFEVNEASLTGESMPVEKNAAESDKQNIFLGTIVAKGRATARILKTGMDTRFGSLAQELSVIKKEETPLEKKLQIIARQIGVVALTAALAIIVIGLLHHNSLINMFLTGISLAVAAVPEGLPAVITITLALGVQRMARQKAILRKLSAIESVGSITVIATDKTGTLTKNQMHVVRIWIADTAYTTNEKIPDNNIYTFNKLLKICVICNNATLAPIRNRGLFEIIGDNTEGALLLLAREHTIDIESTKRAGTLLDEFAFDATTKTMSVLFNDSTGTHIFSKGAPESILDRCTRSITSNGEEVLTHKEKERITKEFEAFAKDGLRLIAFAMKKESTKNLTRTDAESDCTFIGFVGIADPAREEVKESINLARGAGIQTIMITGDNALTAYAIAKHINLIGPGEEVITGKQFETLTDAQVRNKLTDVRVFARTTPEQKLRIVRILQSMGHIVAVTGDGVNDALALKQADVGVAMGVTGTDVAKEAADMIITDDNYATIVSAIEEGRAIYDNMKASIKYLIGCNIGEIIALLGGSLLGWPLILAPIHILYMNLATDGLQAIALAVNPKHHAIMKRKPRTENRLFNKRDVHWLAEVSVLTALSTLIVFYIGWQIGGILLGRTLAFTIIILAQQCIYLDISSHDHTIFSRRVVHNPWIVLPVAVMIIQGCLMYIPSLQRIFTLTSPPIWLLGTSIFICLFMIVFSELRKRFARSLYYDHLDT